MDRSGRMPPSKRKAPRDDVTPPKRKASPGGVSVEQRTENMDEYLDKYIKTTSPMSVEEKQKMEKFLQSCPETKGGAATWIEIFFEANSMSMIRKGEMGHSPFNFELWDKYYGKGKDEGKGKGKSNKGKGKAPCLIRRHQDVCVRYYWSCWTWSIVRAMASQKNGTDWVFRVSKDIAEDFFQPFESKIPRCDLRIFYVEMLDILRRKPCVQRVARPRKGACPFDHYLQQEGPMLAPLLYYLLGGYYSEDQVKEMQTRIAERRDEAMEKIKEEFKKAKVQVPEADLTIAALYDYIRQIRKDKDASKVKLVQVAATVLKNIIDSKVEKQLLAGLIRPPSAESAATGLSRDGGFTFPSEDLVLMPQVQEFTSRATAQGGKRPREENDGGHQDSDRAQSAMQQVTDEIEPGKRQRIDQEIVQVTVPNAEGHIQPPSTGSNAAGLLSPPDDPAHVPQAQSPPQLTLPEKAQTAAGLSSPDAGAFESHTPLQPTSLEQDDAPTSALPGRCPSSPGAGAPAPESPLGPTSPEQGGASTAGWVADESSRLPPVVIPSDPEGAPVVPSSTVPDTGDSQLLTTSAVNDDEEDPMDEEYVVEENSADDDLPTQYDLDGDSDPVTKVVMRQMEMSRGIQQAWRRSRMSELRSKMPKGQSCGTGKTEIAATGSRAPRKHTTLRHRALAEAVRSSIIERESLGEDDSVFLEYPVEGELNTRNERPLMSIDVLVERKRRGAPDTYIVREIKEQSDHSTARGQADDYARF